MAALMRDHDIEILNVAGPRASEWAGGYDYTLRAIDVLLSRIKFSARRRTIIRRFALQGPARHLTA